MSTDGAVRIGGVAPPRALLAALVDDAAIFPPGNAPMTEALSAHLAFGQAAHSWLVGRFLCTASRLGELAAALADAETPDHREPIRLSVVADTGVDAIPEIRQTVADDDRFALAGIEVALPRDGREPVRDVTPVLPDVTVYVEIPRVPAWREALHAVADSPYAAKLRTGGLDASAFPTERELAAFIVECVRMSTAFKLTAGLHNAIRHRDPATGFEHHGFLNAILATDAAVRGADVDDVERLLATTEASVLVALLSELGPDRAACARSFFVSFGSCSTQEPVDDLVALGLMPGV